MRRSAKSRKQCLISSRDTAHCADGGCDLWYSGSSTVWVALFYGLGRTGGKTVRTSWKNHEKVIILQPYVFTYNLRCGIMMAPKRLGHLLSKILFVILLASRPCQYPFWYSRWVCPPGGFFVYRHFHLKGSVV